MAFWQRLQRAPAWPWALRGIGLAFVLLVAALLYRQAQTVDWPGVGRAMQALPAPVLLSAAGLALASHLAYASYDLIGRRLSGHRIPVPTTLGITLISYPFILNLGSLLGGVAARYRLYTRHGLDKGRLAQVIGTSILTNWIGYFLLAGVAFWWWTPPLPEGWQAGALPLHLLGAALAALPAGYVLLCAARGGRALTLRGRRFPLPRAPFALAQVALSAANWMLMSGAVWVLLQGQAPYPAVLATMLFGALAGLVLRVPSGLGVLEAVAVVLLAGSAPAHQVLAAVLAYRALYYFAPLVLASLAFCLVELRHRR